ncbi:MAG TPA: 4Fe-4S binding protein, partial [Polyangiaceae bacterium]|nr:4Fe-4S binding protein [Polyangiaceae bacterium]
MSQRRGVSNDGRELLYSLLFVVVCVTSFVPWTLMSGGTPIFGPTSVGPLPNARHQWIDVHLITSLSTIYLFVRHLILEWRAACSLFRRVFGVARGTAEPAQLPTSSMHKNTAPSLPRTKFRFPFPRHSRTPYVDIQLRECVACYGCVSACQQGVLGKVAIGRHRHVHVDQPTRCTGCGRCVRSCSQRAIRRSGPTPA